MMYSRWILGVICLAAVAAATAKPPERLQQTISRDYAESVEPRMLADAVKLALVIEEWERVDEQADALLAYNNIRDKHEVWVRIEIAETTVHVHFQKSENLDEKPCFTRRELKGICNQDGKKPAMCEDESQVPTCIHDNYFAWIDELLDAVPFAARRLEIFRSQDATAAEPDATPTP